MADIINLRTARKARKRREAASQAATNRARFGQTQAERDHVAAESARQDRTLDGARRERGDD